MPDVNGHSCARLRSRVVLPQPEPPVITNDSPESNRTSRGSTSRVPVRGTHLDVVEFERAVAARVVPSKSVAPLPFRWR